MNIENKNIKINSCTITELENELIAYCEEEKTIVVLNQTATCIWNYLQDAFKQNVKTNQHTLLEYINEKFDITNIELSQIQKDIDETINMLIQNKLIVIE